MVECHTKRPTVGRSAGGFTLIRLLAHGIKTGALYLAVEAQTPKPIAPGAMAVSQALMKSSILLQSRDR